MTYLIIAVFGFISGILGGMGMGGGTFLIPLLGFLDIPQQTIQATNLISFIPMAAATLVVHKKNGLVKNHRVLIMILPAVIFAIVGALLSNVVEDKILKISFGILLLTLAACQIYEIFKPKKDLE
ncbi:MAG TPA: sulfite exporter TauE/SafE family protein [Eubacteriales bacterium]|nr:sulfite exporter TauE/SafE family protein [Eubacteriales bacterium]